LIYKLIFLNKALLSKKYSDKKSHWKNNQKKAAKCFSSFFKWFVSVYANSGLIA